MTFGFRFQPEELKTLRTWRKQYMQAKLEAIENRTFNNSFIGGFSSYEFIPTDNNQWQYKANIPSELGLEPLVIVGGIEAVDDDESKNFSLEDDEYLTLIEHGWTFVTAREYSYKFTPTGFGTAVNCYKLATGEIIDLTDMSNW